MEFVMLLPPVISGMLVFDPLLFAVVLLPFYLSLYLSNVDLL